MIDPDIAERIFETLIRQRPPAKTRRRLKAEAEASSKGAILRPLSELISAWEMSSIEDNQAAMGRLARSVNGPNWRWYDDEKGDQRIERSETERFPLLWNEYIPFRDDYLQIPLEYHQLLGHLCQQYADTLREYGNVYYLRAHADDYDIHRKSTLYKQANALALKMEEVEYNDDFLGQFRFIGILHENETLAVWSILQKTIDIIRAEGFSDPENQYWAKQIIKAKRWYEKAIYTPWGTPTGCYAVIGAQRFTQIPYRQILLSPAQREYVEPPSNDPPKPRKKLSSEYRSVLRNRRDR